MSADDKPAQYNNIYTNDIKELKLNPGVIYFKEYTTRGNPSLPVLQKILQKLVDTGYGYIQYTDQNLDTDFFKVKTDEGFPLFGGRFFNGDLTVKTA